MPQVLLVGITAELQRPLVGAMERCGLEATVLSGGDELAGADQALAGISDDSADIAAMLVGPSVPDPVALTRRAHAIDDGLSVLLLAAPGDPQGVRAAVRFASYLGEDVSVLESVGDDELAERVIEAAERRRQRQAHVRLSAALNPRIGASATPPLVAADFGRLLDQTPVGVVTIDGDCIVRGFNRRSQALFGRSERELRGQALPGLFTAPDHGRVSAHLDRAIRGLEPDREILDRSAMHGEPQFLELSAVAADVGGGTRGAIALVQDVTAREQARRERDRSEEALRQQQQWYEATVLGIGDGIIATDGQGRITLMNPVAEQLTGWSQADARGVDSRCVFDIVDEHSGAVVTSPVTRALLEGTVVGLANHTVLRARDGRRLPIDDSGAPIRDSEGKIAGVVLVFRDVSERRRSERTLRESEQRFRTIFAQAAAGIALVSPEARIVEVNQRFCGLVGYDRDELLAMDDPVATLTHPDDLAADEAESAALAAGERSSFQLEKRYLHKQGHSVWARLAVSALRDADGDIQQFVSIVEDIDESKRAEAALQASEERLRLILESLTDHAVFTMDLHGRVTDWNGGAKRILGYDDHEIVGHFGDLIFSEQDRREGVPDRELQTALEHGQALNDRWQMRKDGSYFWANGITNTLGHGGDEPQGFVKILRDQTEAKRAQDQLEARARQQATIATFGQRALAGHAVGDLLDEAAGTVAETLGVEFCEILRLLPDEHVLQLEARHGWPADVGDAARMKPERDSQAGYTMAFDHPIVVEDLPAETRFTPPPLLRDVGVVSGMTVVIAAGEGGSAWGVLGAHSRERRRFSEDDVNFLQAIANTLAAAIGRRRTEQRLRDLNQTLEQRVAERTAEIEQRAAQLRALTVELTQTEQRERRRLAQALHDNLQQMLVAAKLQLGTATRGVADADGEAALERVGDLLDRSVQESRSLTVELSPPVLYEAGLVAGLEWLGRWMQEQHGLGIDLQAKDDVDPAEDDLRVLLFQAARELLFNIVKHAAADRAAVVVERDADGRIVLQVRDRGSGFDPAHNAPMADAGHGFGLFSIRERLARLGGELQVDSAPGEGTRVTVAVPEDTAPTEAEPPPQVAPTAAEPASRTAGASTPRPPTGRQGVIRVVIADDHVIVREGLVGVLSGQPDIEVVGEAGDGQEAVDLARQEHPDVAVLDVTMPRMNGIEAARVISDELPAIRVIGLSVHETSDMAGAMRNAGAATYLNKAGPSNRLLAAIRGQALD